MKLIPVRTGFFALLIFEAFIISLVAIAFMINLYNIYTNLVYTESAEVLNLNTNAADSKLSYIENVSFEVLSNPDIQKNLLQYNKSPDTYEGYKAFDNLYTQLFSRWVMDRSLISVSSVSFVFPDGKHVDAGRWHSLSLPDEKTGEIVNAAYLSDGACGWMVNAAGDNSLTLYRLIKDISGNGFRPQGVLIINVKAEILFDHKSSIPQKYKPEIVCVADGQILSREPVSMDTERLLSFMKSEKVYNIVSYNHKQHFITVKTSNFNGWHFVYVLSIREMLSSIYNINAIYGVILLAILAVVITVGYGLANSISRPIARLTKTMKVVEGGDYSAVFSDPTPGSRIAIAEVVQLSRDFYQMVYKIDNLINEGYVKQLTIMEMKYKMLQQQINPHFLYNTLDTINWKAIQNSNNEISVMVRSLSGMLRGSISEADIITIREDLRFVEDYIAIQKIRFEERLDFKVEIPARFHECKIPKLTLQPIVENCIVHNLEKYSGICAIRIVSSVSEGLLKISIEDNGRGTDMKRVEMVLNGEAKTADRSIGLKNINQRLKISFGDRHGIHIENIEPLGTRVTILLPCMEVSYENAIDRR